MFAPHADSERSSRRRLLLLRLLFTTALMPRTQYVIQQCGGGKELAQRQHEVRIFKRVRIQFLRCFLFRRRAAATVTHAAAGAAKAKRSPPSCLHICLLPSTRPFSLLVCRIECREYVASMSCRRH